MTTTFRPLHASLSHEPELNRFVFSLSSHIGLGQIKVTLHQSPARKDDYVGVMDQGEHVIVYADTVDDAREHIRQWAFDRFQITL